MHAGGVVASAIESADPGRAPTKFLVWYIETCRLKQGADLIPGDTSISEMIGDRFQFVRAAGTRSQYVAQLCASAAPFGKDGIRPVDE